ncbi:site-2 protease family protein [candidate division WWE3 bacterium]|nr:site-2 protease family protein [candidate division WWE3 bacterium]
MRFSEIEISELAKAWVAISFAFAIAGRGGFDSDFGYIFLTTALTVGVAFILHELAHKFVAQRFGCWAEFRSYDTGLILAIVMSIFTGFVFAAPGAVMISGLVTADENGKIAAAGPITNLILAGIFWILILFAPSTLNWMVFSFLYSGFTVNAWLALFNLIPIPPLDGSKILPWSRPVWITLLAIAGYLTFFVF